MLHDYKIEVDNSNDLKDNTMLNCSMELSLLNNLFRDNLKIKNKDKKINEKVLTKRKHNIITKQKFGVQLNKNCYKKHGYKECDNNGTRKNI